MKSRLVTIAAIALLAFSLAGCSSNQSNDSTSQSASTGEKTLPFTMYVDGVEINRKDISQAFKSNEIAAESEYIGKPIIVESEVLSVTGGPQGIYGFVTADNGYVAIQGGCHVEINDSDLATATSLQKGDKVRVTGVIDAYDETTNAIILLDDIMAKGEQSPHNTKIEKM